MHCNYIFSSNHSALVRSEVEKPIVPETIAGSGILLGYLWDIKSDMKMWSNGWDRERWMFESDFLMRAWELMSGCSIREKESKQQANTEQSNRQTNKKKRRWIMSGKWKLMRKWSGGLVRCEEARRAKPEGDWESGWKEMEGRMEKERKKSEQAKRGRGCCFKISADECVSPLWGGVPSALYVCHSTRLCLASRER